MKTISIVFVAVFFLTASLFAGALLKLSDSPANYAEKAFESVYVEINDQVAITEVVSTFCLDASDSFVAQFLFPLPENANVISAEKWIGEEWIACSLVAIVDSSDSGIGTGGLSGSGDHYLGGRPFILEIYTGVPYDIRVRFRYIELLEYDKGDIYYEYPAHKPDYITSSTDSFEMTISLNTSREILSSECSYTEMSTYLRGFGGSFRLNEYDFVKDEPLEMSYKVASDEIGFTAMFHKEDSDTGYFLFIIEPPLDYDSVAAIPKDFIFVLDKSGSMSGEKLINARRTAVECIENLNYRDRINFISYNQDVLPYDRCEMYEASEYNKTRIISSVNGCTAGGSTNIYDALAMAIDIFPCDRLSELIFLTDGIPNHGAYTTSTSIRENIQRINEDRGVAIYSIGLGSNADSTFLKNLAFENRGQYLKVNSSNIEAVVTELFSYLNYPVLNNPSVEVASITTSEMYPINTAALFMGQQLIVSGIYYGSGNSDVILHGEDGMGAVEFAFEDIEFPSYVDSLPFVSTLWAKQYIDYWMAWMNANGEVDSLVESVTNVALQYGIVCRYTEYFHGEEEEEEEDTTGSSEGIAELAEVTVRTDPTQMGIRLEIQLINPEIVDHLELYRAIGDGGDFENIGIICPNVPFYDDIEKGSKAVYQIAIHYKYGVVEFTDEFEAELIIPGEFYIGGAYPNPFNAALRIDLLGNEHQMKTVTIYDINGNAIRNITSSSNHIIWDGHDDYGKAVKSGIYLIKTNSKEEPQKVMLIR